MNIPKLQIGNLIAKFPIVQGGMGVRISMASLAAAVAEAGGIGTISSIGLGDFEASQRAFSPSISWACLGMLRSFFKQPCKKASR